jgi:hypothetical protein
MRTHPRALRLPSPPEVISLRHALKHQVTHPEAKAALPSLQTTSRPSRGLRTLDLRPTPISPIPNHLSPFHLYVLPQIASWCVSSSLLTDPEKHIESYSGFMLDQSYLPPLPKGFPLSSANNLLLNFMVPLPLSSANDFLLGVKVPLPLPLSSANILLLPSLKPLELIFRVLGRSRRAQSRSLRFDASLPVRS